MVDNIENITDSMNQSGHEGKWYSYIDNMNYYRVRYLDDEITIWKADDLTQHLVDSPEVRNILNEIRRHIQ